MFKNLGDKDTRFYATAAIFILAFFLYVLLFDNVLVTSTGMEPSLKSGDYVLVSSAAYTFSLPVVGRVKKLKEPERGDLVFFQTKAHGKEGERSSSILRVVGTPGETLKIVNKEVLIDDRPLKEPYVSFSDTKVYPEGLSSRDNFGPFVVPEDSYFLLGDKRDITVDSRFFGFIVMEEIKGKVIFIYWSTDLLNGLFKGSRRERIGVPRSPE